MHMSFTSRYNDTPRYYGKLSAPLVKTGAASSCRFGDAGCLLISCRRLTGIATGILLHMRGAFDSGEALPGKLLRSVFSEQIGSFPT